jgi:hypothetical protein
LRHFWHKVLAVALEEPPIVPPGGLGYRFIVADRCRVLDGLVEVEMEAEAEADVEM